MYLTAAYNAPSFRSHLGALSILSIRGVFSSTLIQTCILLGGGLKSRLWRKKLIQPSSPNNPGPKKSLGKEFLLLYMQAVSLNYFPIDCQPLLQQKSSPLLSHLTQPIQRSRPERTLRFRNPLHYCEWLDHFRWWILSLRFHILLQLVVRVELPCFLGSCLRKSCCWYIKRTRIDTKSLGPRKL